MKKGFNLIILDEPTNDLDVEVLSSLEGALSEFQGLFFLSFFLFSLFIFS